MVRSVSLLLVVIFYYTSCHDVPVKNKPQPDKDHPDEGVVEIEDDDEHVDFEPVIEFPDDSPDYKERARNGADSELAEHGHWQLHKIINGIVHKEIQTAEMIEDFKRLARNGTKGGSMIKPYIPMKKYAEKMREEEERKAKEAERIAGK